MNEEKTEEIQQKMQDLYDEMEPEECAFIENYLSKMNQVFLNQIRRIIS